MDWGKVYWKMIHFLALHNIGKDFLNQLVNFLPCDKCKEDWIEPTDDLIEWSLEYHNKVNKKMGKYDKWKLYHLKHFHKKKCDYCNNITEFPWNFMLIVAETYNTKEAYDFLMELNRIYPCDACRNTFFQLEKQPHESVLTWVKKNNDYMNKIRGFDVSKNTPRMLFVNPTPRKGKCKRCPG